MIRIRKRILFLTCAALAAALSLIVILPAFANSGDYGIAAGPIVVPTQDNKGQGVQTAVATIAATPVPPTATPVPPTSVPPTSVPATAVDPIDPLETSVPTEVPPTNVPPTATP